MIIHIKKIGNFVVSIETGSGILKIDNNGR